MKGGKENRKGKENNQTWLPLNVKYIRSFFFVFFLNQKLFYLQTQLMDAHMQALGGHNTW